MARQRLDLMADLKLVDMTEDAKALTKSILASRILPATADRDAAHIALAEYEEIFRSFGITPRSRASMYTTVHYVVRANQKTKVTCEVQVRTLMEEVWGEVSHRVNYPTESPSLSCQNQLKVLARLTTGGTRLVDSIFSSHSETSSGGSANPSGKSNVRTKIGNVISKWRRHFDW
jgi:hypothetical protein